MMISALDYFSALVQQDEDFPLFEAALAIAQDADPWLDFAAVQETVDGFAAQVLRRLPAGASDVQKLRMLNHFFYNELGFAGNVNDYYDPGNSYLQRVIESRRGIPISLAVIYMELAQQIGLAVRGVAFPGHFLMKLSVPSGEIILDPFNGASLTREELEERLAPYLGHYHQPELSLAAYLQTASPRAILARMLHNLKALFTEHQDWERMLEVQQRLVILLPNEVTERRDRGLAYAHLDYPQAALEDLQAYLSECPYASDAQSLRERLTALRRAGEGLQ
ncbi:SirB1 family protein [Noviherbaspirillum sedimenti]|uniref:Transglutaminase n=1 Tax=Noviherbaspirillum sedimenti TaxID=2320865 RepID=A0A3A3G1K7_9BURK|nr:tetratricopeptide repeat protein [Noviherbaspirillum sedimenti]RJG01784.1 transglutaminase [Noviherbaspirillum sedimenti]